jgi:hypothetical protein
MNNNFQTPAFGRPTLATFGFYRQGGMGAEIVAPAPTAYSLADPAHPQQLIASL